MTIQEATDVVQDYFFKRCPNSAFFTFTVNNAVKDKTGNITIWCSHACYYTEQHHRVLVHDKTGEVLGVQKLESAKDWEPKGDSK
jgi:hypothetical protein